jgi:hypothetical protein
MSKSLILKDIKNAEATINQLKEITSGQWPKVQFTNHLNSFGNMTTNYAILFPEIDHVVKSWSGGIPGHWLMPEDIKYLLKNIKTIIKAELKEYPDLLLGHKIKLNLDCLDLGE